MSPQELLARYQGLAEVAKAKLDSIPKGAPLSVWVGASIENAARQEAYYAAKEMLAVCRSAGL